MDIQNILYIILLGLDWLVSLNQVVLLLRLESRWYYIYSILHGWLWFSIFTQAAMLMIFIDIQDDKMLHMSFWTFECQCDKVRKFHNLLHELSLWAKVSTTWLIQTSLQLSLCLSIAIREKLLSQLLNVSLGTIIGFL